MAELRISLRPANIRFTRAELSIIKSYTPVKTGRLRRTWTIDGRGDLVNDTPYGEFVEFGTKHMAARNFCKRAMPELMKSVVLRLLVRSQMGQKLVDAVSLAVMRGGSFRAVYRNTINPKFYRHLLTAVGGLRARMAARRAS